MSVSYPIHGADILIFKGSETTPLAGPRNVTINYTCDTVETHTKSNFPAKTYMASWEGWTASFDGVYNGDTMATALHAGDEVAVKIQVRTAASTYEQIYAGNAIITEFSIEAGQDDITTFSCSLQGTGALTIGAGTQGGTP